MGSTTGIYITSKRNITQNTVTSYNSLNSQNVRYLVTNRALQTATYIAPFCIICIRRWAVRLAFTDKRNIAQNTLTSYNSLNSQNVRYLVTNRALQIATYIAPFCIICIRRWAVRLAFTLQANEILHKTQLQVTIASTHKTCAILLPLQRYRLPLI